MSRQVKGKSIDKAGELLFADELKSAKPLSTSEVFLTLQTRIQEQARQGYEGQQENESFDKFYQYAEKFAVYNSANTVKQVHALLQRVPLLHDFERASLATLLPNTVEEARALIPSLNIERNGAKLEDDDLEGLLEDLIKFRDMHAG
eukprot:Clim_evm80s172 gene=Clim_evmTU80s172